MASNADMGFSGYRIGSDSGQIHGGVHDETPFVDAGPRLGPQAALALHGMPSAKMFRRAFLLEHDISFPPHALQSWHIALQVAAAGTCLRLPGAGMVQGEAPATRSFWHASAPRLEDLAATVDAVVVGLPQGWLGPEGELRLLARAIWERLHFATFTGPAAKSDWGWQAQALWQVRSSGLKDISQCSDPYMSKVFRDFLTGAGDLP